MQRHLREHLPKIKSYDDLEELYAELYRREADGEKLGGFNQLEKSDEKIDDEKEKGEEWLEQTWLDVWSPEYGWVHTLQALEAKRPLPTTTSLTTRFELEAMKLRVCSL